MFNTEQLKLMVQLQGLQGLKKQERAQNGNDDAFKQVMLQTLGGILQQSQQPTTQGTLQCPHHDCTSSPIIKSKLSPQQLPTTAAVAKGEFGYQPNRLNMASLGNNPKYNQYDSIIEEMGQKYNVDPKLIKSMIKHESNFNTNTVSHAGAAGLMQLMPVNAKEFNVSDRHDPRQNIEAGTREIRKYLDKYDGDLKLSLAAYNAGMGNVKKYGGVPPFKETENYLKRVMTTYYSA